MASKIALKNNINSEFEIVHSDGIGAVSVTSKDMAKINPVDTVAALRAMTYTPSTVWLSGYHEAGDGAFGSNIFRWSPESTETDNGGTVIKLDSIATGRYELQFDGAVNVRWFGAVDCRSIFTITASQYSNISDSKIAIQNAINYINTIGGGVVAIDGVFGVSSNITLKNNVSIVGSTPTGFFNSGLYQATGTSLTDTTSMSMIVAISSITGIGVISTEDHSYRNWKAEIKNLVICGNLYADYGLRTTLSTQQEHSLYLNNVSCELALLDGIRADNAVAMVWDYVKSYANGRYGINIYSGTTDCHFSNLYIHTNNLQAILLNVGTLINTFSLCKFEDNYNIGVKAFDASATFTDCTFQNNSFECLELNDGSSIKLSNCRIISNNTDRVYEILIKTNSSLDISNSTINGVRAKAINLVSGTLYSSNNRYGQQITSCFNIAKGNTFSSTNDTCNNVKNTSASVINGDSIVSLVNSSTSKDFIFKLPTGGFPFREYWDFASIIVNVQWTQWGEAPRNNVAIVGLGSVNGSISTSVTSLASSISAGLLDSVSYSYNNTTREFKVTVTTGATWGTGGRASAIGVSYKDFGISTFK